MMGKTFLTNASNVVFCVFCAGLATGAAAQDTEILPIPLITDEAPTAAASLDVSSSQDIEVLTRGPIHEAFVTQVPTNPASPKIVSKSPPAPINELPPDVRPEGDNVQWIPGYWTWDAERDDFVWVSGTWRVAPAGRNWVPGYWAPVQGPDDRVVGHQWVSGFWSDAQQQVVEYHEPPPASLEQGPTHQADSNEVIWSPGSWVVQNETYAWQPGCYRPIVEDRIWIPSYYTWTPQGCVYVNGYWDYRVPNRGQLFTPICVQSVVAARPTFVYQPRYYVDMSGLFQHLFVCPTQRHYYFGDYYAANYNRVYHPFANYHRQGIGYDPLYCYYSNYFGRQGINYGARLSAWNLHFQVNLNSRPPRTLHDHLHRHQRGPQNLATAAIVHSILSSQGSRARNDYLRTVKLNDARKRAAIAQAQRVRDAQQRRMEKEHARRRDFHNSRDDRLRQQAAARPRAPHINPINPKSSASWSRQIDRVRNEVRNEVRRTDAMDRANRANRDLNDRVRRLQEQLSHQQRAASPRSRPNMPVRGQGPSDSDRRSAADRNSAADRLRGSQGQRDSVRVQNASDRLEQMKAARLREQQRNVQREAQRNAQRQAQRAAAQRDALREAQRRANDRQQAARERDQRDRVRNEQNRQRERNRQRDQNRNRGRSLAAGTPAKTSAQSVRAQAQPVRAQSPSRPQTPSFQRRVSTPAPERRVTPTRSSNANRASSGNRAGSARTTRPQPTASPRSRPNQTGGSNRSRAAAAGRSRSSSQGAKRSKSRGKKK